MPLCETQELPACSWPSFLYSYSYILKSVMNFELIFTQNVRLNSSLLFFCIWESYCYSKMCLKVNHFSIKLLCIFAKAQLLLSTSVYFCVIYFVTLLLICPYLSISLSYYKYLISSNILIFFMYPNFKILYQFNININFRITLSILQKFH